MKSKIRINKSKGHKKVAGKKNASGAKHGRYVRSAIVRKNVGRKLAPQKKKTLKGFNKAPLKKTVAQKSVKALSAKKVDRTRKSKKNDVSLKVLTAETVESLKKDKVFTDYVNTKIGKRADEIIISLASPMTDEGLAEKLEMKINDTRRVLNMLNTDGVARYIVNKNNKGWLTFKWYIDEDNLKKMRGEVVIKAITNNTILPDNCNDFYVCSKCYSNAKLVYPFEVGYEMDFKCGECGSFFERKSKEDIEKMLV